LIAIIKVIRNLITKIRKCEKEEERNLWFEKFSFYSLQCSTNRTLCNTIASEKKKHGTGHWIWRQTARESQFRMCVTFFLYVEIIYRIWRVYNNWYVFKQKHFLVLPGQIIFQIQHQGINCGLISF